MILLDRNYLLKAPFAFVSVCRTWRHPANFFRYSYHIISCFSRDGGGGDLSAEDSAPFCMRYSVATGATGRWPGGDLFARMSHVASVVTALWRCL